MIMARESKKGSGKNNEDAVLCETDGAMRGIYIYICVTYFLSRERYLLPTTLLGRA